jgi:ubiquinone/menaquinone biosynthesis C-methylase UbiE
MIIDFIKSKAKVSDNALEIGGGSGAFLDLIMERMGISNAYNLEFVTDPYRLQVNPLTTLIKGTAVSVPFKSECFDWVIMKNLLHHLIGDTRKASKENVKKAIEEGARVLKKNGHFVILEEYNQHDFFGSIVFYLTLLLSRLNMRIRPFGWERNVIVSFMTPEEILSMTNRIIDCETIIYYRTPIDVPLRFKISILMSRIGRATIIMKRIGQPDK